MVGGVLVTLANLIYVALLIKFSKADLDYTFYESR